VSISHRGASVALLVSFSAGCSSSYVPAVSPRLSLVQDGGGWAYVRDGKKYDGNIFGGELDKAVEGNPQAEKYAHEYQSGRAAGFLISLLGASTAVGGLVVFDAQANAQSSSQNLPVTGLIIIGAGLIADLIGAGIQLSAMPHMYDAINAYNDGLSGPPGAPPPAPPPAQGSQKF